MSIANEKRKHPEKRKKTTTREVPVFTYSLPGVAVRPPASSATGYSSLSPTPMDVQDPAFVSHCLRFASSFDEEREGMKRGKHDFLVTGTTGFTTSVA